MNKWEPMSFFAEWLKSLNATDLQNLLSNSGHLRRDVREAIQHELSLRVVDR